MPENRKHHKLKDRYSKVHITWKRNDPLADKQAKRETRLRTYGMTQRAAE